MSPSGQFRKLDVASTPALNWLSIILVTFEGCGFFHNVNTSSTGSSNGTHTNDFQKESSRLESRRTPRTFRVRINGLRAQFIIS